MVMRNPASRVLSPFAVEIRSPAELGSLIQDFFKPSKRDPRGQQQRSDEVDDVEEEALSDTSASDSEEEKSPAANTDISPNIIATHM